MKRSGTFRWTALAAVGLLAGLFGAAGEPWQDALVTMPLGTNVTVLTRTNTVALMLNALASNNVVKGLVFMPGATDELYFFRRVNATVSASGPTPTLLDCISALTNHTYIQVTYRAPLVLLHTTEDMTDGFATEPGPAVAARLKGTVVPEHFVFNDDDWDTLNPVMQPHLEVTLSPGLDTMDTWHFYRHFYAAWNLTEWQLLEATALAGKTKFTITNGVATFSGDTRRGPIPAENTLKVFTD